MSTTAVNALSLWPSALVRSLASSALRPHVTCTGLPQNPGSALSVPPRRFGWRPLPCFSSVRGAGQGVGVATGTGQVLPVPLILPIICLLRPLARSLLATIPPYPRSTKGDDARDRVSPVRT